MSVMNKNIMLARTFPHVQEGIITSRKTIKQVEKKRKKKKGN